jgi:hypothetical protein
MKQFLSISFVLLLAAALMYPQDVIIIRRKAAVAGCTTPTGSLLTESFGDSSTSCWTSGPSTCNNTWTSTGSTSIDTAPSGAPNNTVCTNALKFTQSATEAYVSRAITANYTTPVDAYFYFYWDSDSLTNGQSVRLLLIGEGATYGQRGAIYLARNGANTQLFAQGSDYSAYSSNLTIDTWYKVQMHLEAGAAASNFKLNDGTPVTFTQAAVNATTISSGVNQPITAVVWIGNIWVN